MAAILWQQGSRCNAVVTKLGGALDLVAREPYHPTSMTDVRIHAGGHSFPARFEADAAPRTVAKFRSLLPYRERIIHVRWSGEACWIPLGSLDLGLAPENATAYPAPGQVLLYTGGVSETEILLAYGPCQFASKAGVLAGNHFLSILEQFEQLAELGRRVLWHGAQEITFEAASA